MKSLLAPVFATLALVASASAGGHPITNSTTSSPASTNGTTLSPTRTNGATSGPTGINGTISSPTTTNTACAAIASTQVNELKANPNATTFSVSPSLAVECLKSVPIYPQRDAGIVDFLLSFVEFQSTSSFLAQPPKDYLIPGVDLVGGLKTIKERALLGAYSGQYEFLREISMLIFLAGDGHFGVVSELLSVFDYSRGTLNGGLISISEDGLSEPKIYLTSDYIISAEDSSFDSSPVDTIDGLAVSEYFEQLVALIPTLAHDPDAAYNQFLDSIPKLGRGENHGVGWFDFLPFSLSPMLDETVIGLANGTTITVQNSAVFTMAFSDIASGDDLYTAVVLPTPSPTTSSSETAGPTSTSTDLPSPTKPAVFQPLAGYPYPFDMHYARHISGYFLNDTGYDDTAVLVINGFSPANEGSGVDPQEFPEVVRVIDSILSEFTATGKKKLIIDLQANGGGAADTTAYVFGSLFPDFLPQDAYRMRATDLVNFMGGVAFDLMPDPSYQLTMLTQLVASNLTADFNPYDSWKDMFGPDKSLHSNDEFTNMIANNLVGSQRADPDTLANHWGVALPRGTLKPEDIIIVTDGVCASACPIFTGWLQRSMGVRTIAMGGRPLQAPMQAMGGTKGGLRWDEAFIPEMLSTVLNATDGQAPEGLDMTLLEDPPTQLSIAAINPQNLYHPKDRDGLPLQFTYEAANCKLYYTPETATSMVSLWKAVVDVAWNGAKCVPGSTIRDDDLIGDTTPAFNPVVLMKGTTPDVPGSLRTVGAQVNYTKTAYRNRRGLDGQALKYVEPRQLKPRSTPVVPMM